MGYRVELLPSARRDLIAVPREVRTAIAVKIDQLAIDPWPAGTARLHGHADLLRVRVGRYRVVYLVEARARVLVIVRIGHRREVYRGLR